MNIWKKHRLLVAVLAFSLFSENIYANDFGISDSYSNEIETRINSMSYSELKETEKNLNIEKDSLNMILDSDSATESEKNTARSRIKEIAAELSLIQKV